MAVDVVLGGDGGASTGYRIVLSILHSNKHRLIGLVTLNSFSFNTELLTTHYSSLIAEERYSIRLDKIFKITFLPQAAGWVGWLDLLLQDFPVKHVNSILAGMPAGMQTVSIEKGLMEWVLEGRGKKVGGALQDACPFGSN